MLKRLPWFCARLVFVVTLLLVIFEPTWFGISPDRFQGVRPSSLLDALAKLDPWRAIPWLCFAVATRLMGICCGIIRWRLLMRGQGLLFPFWYAAKAWFMGRACGFFMPGTTGLDGYRLVESSIYTRDPIKCATIIAVEKLTGLIALSLLVFLTLPLGMRLLEFRIPLLLVMLAIMATAIAIALAFLMNPRAIRLLTAAIPLPGKLRNIADKMGIALTAYADHRATLLQAVLLGLGVHLGVCLMFFGTASAIGAPNVTILDILFASPLVIAGSIIAPTVVSLGVREFGFVFLLGAKAGAAEALIAGHLGFWAGEFAPFALSIPLLLLAGRPSRERFQADLARVRGERQETVLPLPQEEVSRFRRALVSLPLICALAGLMTGAVAGCGEAIWMVHTLHDLGELAVLWWAPAVYGLFYAGLGLLLGLAWVGVTLFANRVFKPGTVFGIVSFILFGGMGCVITFFRVWRDIYGKHMPPLTHAALIAASVTILAIALGLAAWLLAGRGKGRIGRLTITALLVYVIITGVGAVMGYKLAPQHTVQAPSGAPATGPNIILIVVDTLRADALRQFNPTAEAKTPNIDQLARDGLTFTHAFAQSSWTKPSFASIFTGLYPAQHGATSYTSTLPPDAPTIASLLTGAGYYARGFSNNINITNVYGFGRGFSEYTDLEPLLPFYARPSARNLFCYEILRRARELTAIKLFPGRMSVREYYQPAEDVTNAANKWLDTGAGKDRPFYLFLQYMEPHAPYMDWRVPGKGYMCPRMTDDDRLAKLPEMRQAYVQEVRHFDQYLGVLLDSLRTRGLYENTLVMLMSDHGEEFYENGGWLHGETLFEHNIHIPMIIKLPGNVAGGARISSFARLIDVLPTVIDIAGLAVPSDLPGISIADKNGPVSGIDIPAIYAETNHEGNDVKCYRTYDAKVINANEGNPRGLPPHGFYDLAVDPTEQTNLAGRGDARELALGDSMTLLEENMRSGAVNASALPGLTQDQKDALNAIGYLGASDKPGNNDSSPANP